MKNLLNIFLFAGIVARKLIQKNLQTCGMTFSEFSLVVPLGNAQDLTFIDGRTSIKLSHLNFLWDFFPFLDRM